MNIVPILLYGKYPNVRLVVCHTAQLAVAVSREPEKFQSICVCVVVRNDIRDPLATKRSLFVSFRFILEPSSDNLRLLLSVAALVVVLPFFTPIW